MMVKPPLKISSHDLRNIFFSEDMQSEPKHDAINVKNVTEMPSQESDYLTVLSHSLNVG